MAPASRGSPLKKLTGTLSEIGKSPKLAILNATLISMFPQIGGVNITAGKYDGDVGSAVAGSCPMKPKSGAGNTGHPLAFMKGT